MRCALILFLTALLTSCNQTQQQTDVVLFHNGNLLTLAHDAPQQVMAVSQGKILAVGGPELIQQYRDAQKVDLAGATVLPGIVDSHVHVRELGEDLIKADLRGSETVAAMVAALQARYPNPKPNQWLIGQGWDEGVWGSLGYPDRAALDEAFPNHPVALESLHGFAGFYNGRALEMAGINANTPEPEVGNILRRDDGAPTGVMLTSAQKLVNRIVPEPSAEAVRQAILEGLRTMAAAGVTSVHEAGMNAAQLAAFRQLADEGKLPIRVYGMLNGNDRPLMEHWFGQGPLLDPNDFFTVRSIKVFYDGSLGSRTALLAAPYADHPEKAVMTERIPPDQVAWLAKEAAAKGWQMAVHAIGDEANRRVLDIYAQALGERNDHRWRIEHAQVVLPGYYQRVAQMGVISSMQPSHAVGDSRWAEDRLGSERIQNAYAWRKILDAKARLTFNSDLPGEPWTPMETLYFAVNRRKLSDPGMGWYADQALSVMESLRAMTLEGAHAAFQEGSLGSLATGKHADFIVLDKDPTKVDPADLATINVDEVWVGGRLVLERNSPTAPPAR